jgi:MATE family multidrug resistance protein
MKYYLNTYKKEISATLKLAVPVIAGQLGQVMMGIVDSLMVGKLGAVPLAAASLSNSIFFLILVLGIGISQALTPMVAQSVGANQPEKCGQWLRQGLLVCFGSGILLAVITFGVAGLIPFLNQPKKVVPEAMVYMRIMGISIIPIMIFQAYRQYSEGLSIMWPAMILTLAANGLNVFLNWLFIYGNLGFPAMGLKGAGFSTLGTRTTMTIFMIIYVLYAQKYRRFYSRIITFPFGVKWEKIGAIVRIGVATGFQYFFEVGAFSGAAVIIGWMGTSSLAAHQIALSAAAFSFMFAIGVSAAAAIRVGNATGEKNRRAVRLAGFSAFILSVFIMASFAVLFIVFRFTIPSFFIADPEVIRLAASLLIIAALFQVSDGLQCVALGALRGKADVKIPTIATFTSYWVIGLPAGYLLAFPMGLKVWGVWVGLLLGLTSSALLLTTRFHIKSKNESTST